MNKFNSATLAQIDAADPHENTWVLANAGSGKTRVLTDRVARLLFHGTLPERILCLTYTKAAANEMQNRLFDRLGAWAMMPDEDLVEALQKLGEEINPTDTEQLRNARTLFAAALEAPGGLKIQTIHSFCDAILRQFPLEANVSPQFQVLDDRKAIQFRLDILNQMANDGDLAAIDAFARYYTKGEENKFLGEIIQNKDGFKRAPTLRDFNLTSKPTTEDLRQDLITSSEALLKELIVLTNEADGRNDKKTNLRLKSALSGEDAVSDLKNLESIFLVASRDYAPKMSGVPTLQSAKKGTPDKGGPWRFSTENSGKSKRTPFNFSL